MELRHAGKKGMRWGHRKAKTETSNDIVNNLKSETKRMQRLRSIQKIENSKNFNDKAALTKHYLNYGMKSTNKLLEKMDTKNMTVQQAAKSQTRIEVAKLIVPSALAIIGGSAALIALEKHSKK